MEATFEPQMSFPKGRGEKGKCLHEESASYGDDVEYLKVSNLGNVAKVAKQCQKGRFFTHI